MLRIQKQKDAHAARSYYTSKAEYYLGDAQELPSSWGGQGAECLGLFGQVEKADFDALCLNRNPETGECLTARNRAGRIVAYDFNFHVPKSLSLLLALAGDPNILPAFRLALSLTLAEMEQAMQTRVRKRGQMADRTTGNAVWSEHIHLTARPVDGVPDPHLHAHVVFFNATWDGVERQWKASKIADIYRDAPYYQAVFHAHLAKTLADQGYPIERTATGWEVAGLASLLPVFSRRTGEIERLAADRGITDPTVKDKLGAETRQRKRHDATMGELRKLWLARLDDAGRAALANAAPAASAARGIRSPALPVDLAVADAIRHCFGRGQGAVPKKRLLAHALAAEPGSHTVQDIRRCLPSHDILTRSHDGQVFCTRRDPRVIDAERLRRLHDGLALRQRLAAYQASAPLPDSSLQRVAYGR